MTYVTRTYDMKVLGLPTPALKSGAAPVMGACGGAVSGYGVFGFLTWLRLWVSCLGRHMNRQSLGLRGLSATGYQRAPSLLPESARAAYAPRLRASRKDRRILRRGLPASRLYAGLHHLNARRLTVGQFMERACRLSVNGRVGVYRLGMRRRLCQRRDEVCHIGGSLGMLSTQPMVTLKPP